LAIAYEDSAGNKDQALNAARQLIGGKKVPLILGPTLSNEMFAVGPVAVERKIPIVGTSTTANGITAIGPYVFRTSLPESDVVPVTLRTAKEKLGDSRMHWKNRMEVLESVVMHQVQGEGGAAAAVALGTSRIVGRGKRKAKSPADDILSSDPYWPTSAGPDLDYGGAGGDDSDADDGFCVACGESDRCRGGICSAGGRAGWRP
jgi:hypothetical protein